MWIWGKDGLIDQWKMTYNSEPRNRLKKMWTFDLGQSGTAELWWRWFFSTNDARDYWIAVWKKKNENWPLPHTVSKIKCKWVVNLHMKDKNINFKKHMFMELTRNRINLSSLKNKTVQYASPLYPLGNSRNNEISYLYWEFKL